MSFILDALKKSEAERNRKSGPVLMDMRIAPPRRHLPVWVWVIAIVLLANLALLGYTLLRGDATRAQSQPRRRPHPPWLQRPPRRPLHGHRTGTLPPAAHLPATGTQPLPRRACQPVA